MLCNVTFQTEVFDSELLYLVAIMYCFSLDVDLTWFPPLKFCTNGLSCVDVSLNERLIGDSNCNIAIVRGYNNTNNNLIIIIKND